MNLGEYSVRNRVVAWLLVVVVVGGGLLAFDGMGKLEDPAFTLKAAKILTRYPGASAREVQEELTHHLEDALQKMPQLKRIRMSVSRPGLSDILVDFKDEYRSEDLQNVFDELRRKMDDVSPLLPPGADKPVVLDDFGDVYGVYLLLNGEGYSWRDLYDTAERVKKQLVLVPGVRKVNIDGEQHEVVYLDVSRNRLAELGIDITRIAEVLGSQNMVVDAGNVRVGDDYLRISPTGAFDSVQSIGDLLISSSERRLLRLGDIATITRAYVAVPDKLFYINGQPGLSIGISMLPGQNVVDVGAGIDERLSQLTSIIPIGMELDRVYDQPREVKRSVSGFLISVAQAVAIVITVLLLFMGLRAGIVIGLVLLITVAGTLFIMDIFAIELQRISLGALVIALGMLVDNSIVVADSMQVRMRAGVAPVRAAAQTVSSVQWPLLGGTVIGVLAFSAIGLSPDNTGEFASSLFYVILISLSLSWLTAISTTPLLSALLLQPGDAATPDTAYSGRLYRWYRKGLTWTLSHRWLTLGAAIGLLLAAVWGFGSVKSGFFPDSNTPIFFVDVWEAEGTDIRRTRDDALEIAGFIREQAGVVQTATAVGGPHQRFTLVYDAREPTPVYAQIIVRTARLADIPTVRRAVETYMRNQMPWLDPVVKPMRIGPGRDAKIEARFSGPDPQVLRQLAEQAMEIMRLDGGGVDIRNDWRSPVKVVTPIFNELVGRQLGVTRESFASALRHAFEGESVGVYRDGTRLLPIRMRAPVSERGNIDSVRDVQVWSSALQGSIPITQVMSGYDTRWENAVRRGRNRLQTIIASCNPASGPAQPLLSRLKPRIEAINLPPGYQLEWGGEYEDLVDARAGLARSLPMGFLLMILTSVLLFGKLRQPLIIWLTVPMATIGITAGLLATGGAFDFMSLLGALSLIGLLIKNAIVLIEEIDQQIDAGKVPYQALLDASVSRLRPVVLAATTTILGLIPLLSDVFFVNMSVTIMAGLGFASLLTLFVVPALYATLFGIHRVAN